MWHLEEVGVPYELQFTDIMKGEHKQGENAKCNPMGKMPTLIDGEQIVTESAAIGLYLADRYAYGKLSPKVDDPARGTYFRWSFFAPSVIEPAAAAHAAKWEYKPAQAGWGSYDDVIKSMESALEGKQYILGDQFSMADCIFGGTVRFFLMFKMIEPKPLFTQYAERLGNRPALKKADEINAKFMKEHNLKFPGT